MPNFFDDKHYNEYFEKLNSRLSGAEKPLPEVETVKKPAKKGIYKTIRLGKSFYIGAISVALCLVLLIVLINSCNKPDTSPENTDSVISTAEKLENEEKPEALKIKYFEDEGTEKIPETNDAKTAIVVRRSDGRIVAGRDIHKRVPPASTIKIMTMLTAVDHIENFDDTFKMSLKITDPLFVQEASVAGFLNGEEINMTDLLYGMILPSGADAAMGLAIKIAGSEEAFVELMNEKAEKMGLENTHFANVSGLHHKDNYSSAYDMAIITDHAYQNELCRKILSTYKYTTAQTPQNPKGINIASTLFSYMYGTEPGSAVILGGKTGYVNESGYCISSFGENKEGSEGYIAVSLGNSSLWPAIHGQIALYKQFAK